MVSGISTNFSPEKTDELCDMLKLLLQEIQAGNVIDEEIVAIAGKLLEYKSIFKKQHKFLLLKCLNLVKNMKLIEEF